MSTRRAAPFALLVLLLGGWLLLIASTGTSPLAAEEAPAVNPDPEAIPVDDPRLQALAAFGYQVTRGAAPGYIEDRACTPCHAMIAETYKEVGMARSFATAASIERIEDFDAEPYFHEASGRFYQMRETADGGMRFQRWQVDARGQRVNAIEQDVDWVLGSGHTSRVYLYRAASGELFQLPLAWYSQDGGHWALAPGLDAKFHDGVSRMIRRECMFCHNAYPDVPTGSDAPWAAHTFPEELPQGTGCQRCHGPGARHVALAFSGSPRQEIVDAIVAPKRLDPALSRDVCYTCHMQPAVAMMPVRRFGRADYSQRPGDPLSDFLVQTDATIDGHHKGDRFEINHHPYRMEQSACFLESRDDRGVSALSCLSCHDPHRKVPVAERAAHYRQACMTCHQIEDCDLDAMGEATAESVAELSAEERRWLETQDCAGCHMPRRRAQDVVHVVMTDHKITRQPAAAEQRLAPLDETQPQLVTVELLRPDEAPPGAVAEIHRARAVLQAGGGDEALDRLSDLLERHPVEAPEAWLAKARAELLTQRYTDAERSVARLLGMLPDEPKVYRYWGIARSGQGQDEDAVKLLERSVELDPTSHESVFNLAVLLARVDRHADAETHLRRAIELRPHAAPAHRHLGHVLRALDRIAEAETAYRQALAAEPADGESAVALGRLLLDRGAPDEALQVLRHGTQWARDPAPIQAMLAAMAETGP